MLLGALVVTAQAEDPLLSLISSPEATLSPVHVTAPRQYVTLLKKGKKRADGMIIRNNRLQTPVDMESTLVCLQEMEIDTFVALSDKPNAAFKKWMKDCRFSGASSLLAQQEEIEKKQKLQASYHSYKGVSVPKEVVQSITDTTKWDAKTKTLLGNQQGIYHDITSQQTSELQILGIQELIGVGLSNYSGSDASRKKNFLNAASKFEGDIIHPGETYSVVGALSPFTHENGYTSGKIIKEGETDDEMGGGVCQSVTTLFRAWNNAGLEIVKTKPHSKVIGYYGGIGLDATMYEADNPKYNVDLLLKNNSDTSVLIKTIDTAPYQAFLLYGTKDRSVSLRRTEFSKTEEVQTAKWEKTIQYNSGETKTTQFTQKQSIDKK